MPPFFSGSARRGAAAAIVIASSASPALAELCDMRVYDATLRADNSLATQGESDQLFTINEFFVVCFRARSDGYVTLWDRMPQDAPVERVVPGPHYTGAGTVAAQVKGGERTCFGTGRDGYYMTMDAADGVGVGLMWLVFTEDEATHPTADTYDSVDMFSNAWASNALGAGSAPGDGAAAPDPNTVAADDVAACRWERSLEYQYRVRTP